MGYNLAEQAGGYLMRNSLPQMLVECEVKIHALDRENDDIIFHIDTADGDSASVRFMDIPANASSPVEDVEFTVTLLRNGQPYRDEKVQKKLVNIAKYVCKKDKTAVSFRQTINAMQWSVRYASNMSKGKLLEQVVEQVRVFLMPQKSKDGWNRVIEAA
jgi:hypothetical protein